MERLEQLRLRTHQIFSTKCTWFHLCYDVKYRLKRQSWKTETYTRDSIKPNQIVRVMKTDDFVFCSELPLYNFSFVRTSVFITIVISCLY